MKNLYGEKQYQNKDLYERVKLGVNLGFNDGLNQTFHQAYSSETEFKRLRTQKQETTSGTGTVGKISDIRVIQDSLIEEHHFRPVLKRKMVN
jgi:hypothetical protein